MPSLKVNSKSLSQIKFLSTCELNDTKLHLIKCFSEIELDCQLQNFSFICPNLKFFLRVSVEKCSQKESNSFCPYTLKCLNEDVRIRSLVLNQLPGVYLFEIDHQEMKTNIKDLYIVNRTDIELEEEIEKNLISNSIDSTRNLQNQNTIQSIKDKIESLKLNFKQDINSVRLKLQILIYNLETGQYENYLTKPYYTDPVENISKETLSDFTSLKIIKSSLSTGIVSGGDDMIL